MSILNGPEGWSDIELQMAVDAFKNAETPEEALDVIAFSSTGGDREQAIVNFTMGATEHSIRSVLASILIGWMKDGYTESVLDVMSEVAQHDYYHALEELGLPTDGSPFNEDV